MGPKRLAATAFVTAIGSTGLGFLIGARWLLPGLDALAIYPFYVELILKGQRRKAVALALLWTVFLSQATIAGTVFFPERAEKVVLRGQEYRAEMFEWVRTSQGKESTPRLFIPDHVRDFAVFTGLAVLTGGFGALFLGAALMNYMNFYAGALVAASAHPGLTLVLAWQPYAIMRVIGYITIATVLAEVFFGVLTRHRVKRRGAWRYAAVGFSLVVADVIVKALIAPAWARLLRWTVGQRLGL